MWPVRLSLYNIVPRALIMVLVYVMRDCNMLRMCVHGSGPSECAVGTTHDFRPHKPHTNRSDLISNDGLYIHTVHIVYTGPFRSTCLLI